VYGSTLYENYETYKFIRVLSFFRVRTRLDVWRKVSWYCSLHTKSSPTKQYNRYQLKIIKSKKYNNNEDNDDNDDNDDAKNDNDNKNDDDNYNWQPQQSTISSNKRNKKGYSDIEIIKKK
jgi:hypothetical protein